MGTKRVSLDMDEEFHKRLKLAAVREDTTIRDFCLTAIRKALDEREDQLSDRELSSLSESLNASQETKKRINDRRGGSFRDDSVEIIRKARDRH